MSPILRVHETPQLISVKVPTTICVTWFFTGKVERHRLLHITHLIVATNLEPTVKRKAPPTCQVDFRHLRYFGKMFGRTCNQFDNLNSSIRVGRSQVIESVVLDMRSLYIKAAFFVAMPNSHHVGTDFCLILVSG